MRTVDDSDPAPGDLDVRIAAITAEAASADGTGFIERSIGSLLGFVREQLSLEVVFVGEFVNGNRVFRHIAARPGQDIIQEGQFHPLDETICLRILDGRMAGLVPDVTSVRTKHALPGYYHGMGAHVGVPVRFSDGSLYGMLCGFSFEPGTHLEDRDIRRLEMAADSIARLLAQAAGHDVRLPHTR